MAHSWQLTWQLAHLSWLGIWPDLILSGWLNLMINGGKNESRIKNNQKTNGMKSRK